ncbi:unnamed protein product [Peniophora sp. CBMAI 1063]|nr:unnamed protein product [Peniophora sp. CBMAI 1063]
MTGLAQPCDVRIQCPYKLAIKRSQLQDIYDETLRQLANQVDPDDIHLDHMIGTLRDCSVGWFLKVWQDISVPSLVKKAFEKCTVPDTPFNLSFESITSSAALKFLRELPCTDPELYAQVADKHARGAGEMIIDDEDDLASSESDLEEACPFEFDDLAADSESEADAVPAYDEDAEFDDDTALEPADLMATILAAPQPAG